MKYFALFAAVAVVAALTAGPAHAQEPIPGFQLTIPYAPINDIISDALDALNQTLPNILPPPKPLSFNTTVQVPKVGKFTIKLQSVGVAGLGFASLENFLQAAPNNTLHAEIGKIDLAIQINGTVNGTTVFRKGKAFTVTVALTGINLYLEAQFAPDASSPVLMSGVLQALNVTFSNLTVSVAQKDVLPENVTAQIEAVVSDLVNSYTSNIFTTWKAAFDAFFTRPLTTPLPLGNTTYDVSFAFPGGFYVQQAALTIPLNVTQITNRASGVSFPPFTAVSVSGYENVSYAGDPSRDLQILVGSELTQQIAWLLYDSNVFNFTLGAESTANTFNVLVPVLQVNWPYAPARVNLAAAPNTVGNIIFRGGRAQISLPVYLGFRVQDTSAQGAPFIDVVTISTNLFLTLNVYQSVSATNATDVRLKGVLQNLVFTDCQIVSQLNGTNTDASVFETSINSAVGGLLPSINTKLQAGLDAAGKVLSRLNLLSLNGYGAIVFGVPGAAGEAQ